MAVMGLVMAFAATVSAQNFTFTMEPSSLTLVPGQSASFVISLTPLNGFTNPVTLSVSTLPSGVTAVFSPQTLTPPGTSLLTLNATTNAANGTFTLNVTGTGGGITNTTSSSVSVSFGLLPICTGAFQGTITDTQSGQPVPYAVVVFNSYYSTMANALGQYLITNLPLASAENLPEEYSIVATRTNYWTSTTNAYAVCDATNIVNLSILLQQEGSISGILTAEGGQPLTNVTVNASSEYSYSAVTDSNGFFQFPSLSLNNNNASAYYTVSTTPAGYWQVETNTTVQANSNSVVDLVAIPICHVTITGSVVYGNSGLPATNLPVSIYTYGEYFATTDSNGNYTVTNATLGNDNAPLSATVEASPSGYYTSSTNVAVSNCNQIAEEPVLRLTPVPVLQYNYGMLTGMVFDVQTLLPLTNAYVEIDDLAVYTDTNGNYAISNIYVGTGTTTNAYYGAYAELAGYFESASNVVIEANETASQNFYLVRIGYGAVDGTVVNSATGLPVSGVYVTVGNGIITGSNGTFASGPIQLNYGNPPTLDSFSASKTGYWTTYTNTTLTNGITNQVTIDLIQVCTGATIVGNVVNALTQQPITNATISDYNQNIQAMTDTNGNFILTNLTVGNDNSPSSVSLTASAPGFNPQTKTLTIFCDAVISTQFGAPETAFGTIDGYVTNVLTGDPITNVFIGSSFGEATTTDTNGYYILSQAPLGANGASRTWTVTAIPNGFPSQTASVVVSSNVVSQQNFGFGQPPTELTVLASGAPNPVTVGSNLVYTITLTNSVANAANVLLTDILPPGVTFLDAFLTNNPGGEFGAPILTNGLVTILATNFSSNSVAVLLVSVAPTVAGTLTNVVTVTSDTADLNPSGTNRTATVITTVIAPVLPTELLVTVQATPSTPIPVGSNLLYTVTLTNTIANAANVTLVDTLPPSVDFISASVSNSPGGTFSAPVYSDGTVTTSAAIFGSNSAVVLFINVTPAAAGSLTNFTTVTSTTTNLAAGTSLSATVTTAATASTLPPPYADLGVSMIGAPNPVLVSNQLTYTLYVTNFGPATASVILTDSLPANVTFSSAVVSQGGYALIPNGVQWTIGTLSNQAFASASIVILPLLTGAVTNTASVSVAPTVPAVTDTNLANNTASFVTTVTSLALTNITFQAGPITFNPQTGLYQQSLQVNNFSGITAAAVRVAVLGLPANVTLYNATGSTNGAPYVEYDQPIASGGDVVFLLEYYDSTRQPFVSTNFVVTVVAAVTVPTPTGTFLQLDTNSPFMSEGQLTIEFASVPGHTYVVEYSSDMETWLTATPPIVAKNTRTQWIDSGPPVTQSLPGSTGQRFYRIVQIN